MFARDDSRPGLGLCIVAVWVAGIVSSIGLGFVLLPLQVNSAAFSGVSGRMTFTVSNVIALVVVLAVCRAVVAAWIVTRIVTAGGAFVSFGRAVAALLVGNVVGVIAGIVGVLFIAQLGVGGFWLLSFSGFVVSVIVLRGGEVRPGGDADAQVSAYTVPPNAPPGWPGT